jgi:transcriptional regulator with XRE-family HTH domain
LVEERDAPLLAHSQVMSRHRGKSATASEIGALIRAVREQNGCQQKELAERIGVPASQLSRYEAGVDQPKIQILVAISEVFQVKLAELVGGRSPDDVIPIRDLDLRDRLKSLEELDRHYRESAIDMLDSIIARARLEAQAGGRGSGGR